MKNLEQIRAQHALKAIQSSSGALSRAAVNKLPAMIISNGLLATTAFCEAEGGGDNRGGMKLALQETSRHLEDCGHFHDVGGCLQKMITKLSEADSRTLQRATVEALAYISYLKRFAPKQ